MKKLIIVLYIIMILFIIAGRATAATPKQVMPAKRRAEIVATAKALFEPEVRNSLKVGRVKSPFSSAGGSR